MYSCAKKIKGKKCIYIYIIKGMTFKVLQLIIHILYYFLILYNNGNINSNVSSIEQTIHTESDKNQFLFRPTPKAQEKS